MRRPLLIVLLVLASTAAFAQAEAEVPPPSPPPIAIEPDPTATPPMDETEAAPPPPPPRRGAITPKPRYEEEPVAAVRRINRITSGPLTVLAFPLMGISLEYERAITERVSLFAGPRGGVIVVPHVSLSLGARFFPFPKDSAPTGFWVGPELWSGFQVDSGSGYSNWTLDEILLVMTGYTVTWPSGFTMSFGGGLGGGITASGGTTLVQVTNPTGQVGGRIVPVEPLKGTFSLGLQWNLGYAF